MKKEGGRKGSFDYESSLEEVTQKLTFKKWKAEPADSKDPTSAWLTGNEWVIKTVKKVLGVSAYEAHAGVYSGGANAAYWFEILTDHHDGTVMAQNIVEKVKRKIESVRVRLEKSLLYPLLKGGDVDAWHGRPSAHLLLTQDVSKRRGIDQSTMQSKYPLALEWLTRNENFLLERAAYGRFYDSDSAPFYSMFDVGDYTLAEWKVVWPRIARTIEAAVVSELKGKVIVAQETFSFVGLKDELEAYFIAGVMNSTPFRFAVSCFSQPGSKSFGTPSILKRAKVTKFEPRNELHKKIVTEAKRLSADSASSSVAMYEKLDCLCAGLWGIDKKGLKSLQDAYRELYIKAADEVVEEAAVVEE